MKKKINAEIKRLILEILLVAVFTIVSIPLWDYVDNSSLAQVANHYSKMNESRVVITNSKKYIYSESFEEAINERNIALITSYEEKVATYDIFLALKLGTNYDNIMFSNGTETKELGSLYYKTGDCIYFKIDTKELNPKETDTYYYYVWTKDLNKDRNVKIKFIAMQ